MSSTRQSLVRLFTIHQAIRGKRYPTAEGLAGICGVHARTIKRDLQLLRDEFGAPVVYSRADGGYCYTHEFSFNSVPLSEGELLAVCMMRVMADTFNNTPFAPALRRALSKLQVMLPEAMQASLLEDGLAINFLGDPMPPERAETCIHFNTVLRAVEGHRRARLVYYSLNNDAVTRREIDPYLIFYRRGMWYLYAYCHLRCATRDFALERIRGIELLDERFIPPDLTAIRARLAQRFSRIEDQSFDAAIRFEPNTARRIRERVWHPSQRIEEHADGSCILHLTVEGLSSVACWVLGFGPRARPLAPPELVARVREEARAVVGLLS